MFSYEFCEIFKNTFFTEHLWTAAFCTPSLELRCQTKNLRVFWEGLNRSSIAKMVVELLKLWSYYVFPPNFSFVTIETEGDYHITAIIKMVYTNCFTSCRTEISKLHGMIAWCPVFHPK